MSRGSNVLFWIAVFAATVCGTAYVATYAGQAFYPVIYFVILLFVLWPMTIFRWRRIGRALGSPTLYTGYTRTLLGLTLGFLGFVFINYLVCRSLNEGGVPVQLPDGRLILQVGNKIIRVIEPEAYQAAQAVQVRMLSGHLLGFYALAAIALRICQRAEAHARRIAAASVKAE